jgi:hypothetical protein
MVFHRVAPGSAEAVERDDDPAHLTMLAEPTERMRTEHHRRGRSTGRKNRPH